MVPDVARLNTNTSNLADPVDAADALLDCHRVPRNVEIDERVAELQVASLAAQFTAQQDRHTVPERGDRRILLRSAHRPVERGECHAAPTQQTGEVRQAVTMMHEHHLLLGGIAQQQIEQCRLLAPAPSPL